MDSSSDIPWFAEPHDNHVNFPQDVFNAVEPTDSTLPRKTDDLNNDLQRNSMTSDNNQAVAGLSIQRCFLDTVVKFQPGETSTICLKALSLVFRHNRKGLSMAILQTQLKPGMRAPSGASGECRIEDSVLFKVLADISTSKP